MNPNVISAIFKRNFVSYFSNPTGYVFICVFVLLNSAAAFWPAEFFANNLCTLDQLNTYMPLILLVFIPAITMSVWAEERRQGTDELLLTIPAADSDVVIGKYLAAVAIFTVSLAFSVICNFFVLNFLGSPDVGLFLSTNLGYWLMGVAMLAVGMVASFLTSNLTVAFILGALFNVPLAFLGYADLIMDHERALTIKQWSLEEQFRDFGNGVISLSGIVYFSMIAVVMLYVCMVLIGRRHWQGGRRGNLQGMHYTARIAAMLVIVGSVVLLFTHYDARVDVTEEQLSSLSTESVEILETLDPKFPIRLEAFISPVVPEDYVATRLNLLTTLREVESLSGGDVIVRIYDTEPLSDQAERADKQFDIVGRTVQTRVRGAFTQEEIIMGVAFTAGASKVVVPFFDRGTPVEYELIRSISSLAAPTRKRIGVVTTDAPLFASFNPQTFTPQPAHVLIEELEKQFDVVQVSADSPITERFDALLAVQPSTLSPPAMRNFIAAVKSGQPTAIFEDPAPMLARGGVTPTGEPKRPPQQQMMMMPNQQPVPKGDITELWQLLGVSFSAKNIVWQRYNPYPKFRDMPPELVFVDNKAATTAAINDKNVISSGLHELLFAWPGYITPQAGSAMKFEPLVQTGNETGTVSFSDLSQTGGNHDNSTGTEYVLAAQITGALPAQNENMPMADEAPETAAAATKAKEPATSAKQDKINVVLVSDIDLFYPEFFQLRAQGSVPEGFSMNLDNVPFVLNVMDVLVGDQKLVAIRSRRPLHRTLEAIEIRTKGARETAEQQRQAAQSLLDETVAEETKKFEERIKKLTSQTDIDANEKNIRLEMAQRTGQQAIEQARQSLQIDNQKKTRQIDHDLNNSIQQVQNWYKLGAMVIPPIPPLLLAVGVFLNRRMKEREGVVQSRLRTS